MTPMMRRRISDGPRFSEPHDMNIFLSQQVQGDLSEAVVAPTANRDAGSGMETNNDGILGYAADTQKFSGILLTFLTELELCCVVFCRRAYSGQ